MRLQKSLSVRSCSSESDLHWWSLPFSLKQFGRVFAADLRGAHAMVHPADALDAVDAALLAVSDELLLWRPMGDVLGGSDEDFDSLGARSPDALSEQDRIDIVYAGQDGVSFRLGTASRAAPSDTAPSFF